MRAKFVEVVLLSVLIMQMGFGAVNSSGYVAKPKDIMTPSSMVTGVNETAGLELTVQVEKTVYGQGEPVNITFTLTNISNQTINFPMTAWTFDFQVLNDTNHLIFQYSTSQIFPLVIWNVPINPGENLTNFLVWPQMCNTTAWTAGIAVSPGTYYIAGLLWEISSIIVRTPPLRITVVPAFAVAISPSDVALDIDQSVAFMSNVTGGTPPYSYQWQLNGANVSGATYSSWTFAPCPLGSYNVSLVVTDALGGVETSNTASITVNAVLSVSISPYYVTIGVGQSQTFTANVAGGTRPYIFYWGYGGNLTSAAHSAGTNGPTTNRTWTFTFNSAGNYIVLCLVADSSTGTPIKGPWTAASVAVNAASVTDPSSGGGGGCRYYCC